DGDVIQVAESILKILEARHEILPAPRGFLACEDSRKELGGVAQFFDLYAQFVTALGIQRIQVLPPLQNGVPATAQLLRSRIRDRAIAHGARTFVRVAGPIA